MDRTDRHQFVVRGYEITFDLSPSSLVILTLNCDIIIIIIGPLINCPVSSCSSCNGTMQFHLGELKQEEDWMRIRKNFEVSDYWNIWEHNFSDKIFHNFCKFLLLSEKSRSQDKILVN